MKDKKVEFSKVIFVVVSAIWIYIVLFTTHMIESTGNLEPLNYLIPASAAELATGTGFYYSKAKAENEIKLGKRKEDQEC